MIVRIGNYYPYDSNIYLLRGSRNVLIDTGTGVASDAVNDEIERSLGGGTLDQILLTHCHVDHIGGVPSLIEKYGADVCIGYLDAEPIRWSDSTFTLDKMFGLSVPSIDAVGLHDGDMIDIGEHRLRVLETPGHTKGGVCYFDEITGSLFSGDTLFVNGVGRTDYPGGSYEDLKRSLKYINHMAVTGLYPGHGNANECIRTTIDRGLKE